MSWSNLQEGGREGEEERGVGEEEGEREGEREREREGRKELRGGYKETLCRTVFMLIERRLKKVPECSFSCTN